MDDQNYEHELPLLSSIQSIETTVPSTTYQNVVLSATMKQEEEEETTSDRLLFFSEKVSLVQCHDVLTEITSFLPYTQQLRVRLVSPHLHSASNEHIKSLYTRKLLPFISKFNNRLFEMEQTWFEDHGCSTLAETFTTPPADLFSPDGDPWKQARILCLIWVLRDAFFITGLGLMYEQGRRSPENSGSSSSDTALKSLLVIIPLTLYAVVVRALWSLQKIRSREIRSSMKTLWILGWLLFLVLGSICAAYAHAYWPIPVYVPFQLVCYLTALRSYRRSFLHHQYCLLWAERYLIQLRVIPRCCLGTQEAVMAVRCRKVPSAWQSQLQRSRAEIRPSRLIQVHSLWEKDQQRRVEEEEARRMMQKEGKEEGPTTSADDHYSDRIPWYRRTIIGYRATPSVFEIPHDLDSLIALQTHGRDFALCNGCDKEPVDKWRRAKVLVLAYVKFKGLYDQHRHRDRPSASTTAGQV